MHRKGSLSAEDGTALSTLVRELIQIEALLGTESRARRGVLLARLDAETRLAYEAALKRRLSPLVVALEGGRACGGCHLHLQPRRQVELKVRTLVVCPHCGRFICLDAPLASTAAGSPPGVGDPEMTRPPA